MNDPVLTRNPQIQYPCHRELIVAARPGHGLTIFAKVHISPVQFCETCLGERLTSLFNGIGASVQDAVLRESGSRVEPFAKKRRLSQTGDYDKCATIERMAELLTGTRYESA